MGVWIMSIVGVICLGILLEIMLPEGQTAKYVKGAFSLLIVFVIAAPLPNLLNKDWKLDYDASQFQVDEEYVNTTYAFYADSLKSDAVKLLAQNGYKTTVKITMDEKSPLTLGSIEVSVFNFKHDVEDDVAAHIKILLCERFKCNADVITVRLL